MHPLKTTATLLLSSLLIAATSAAQTSGPPTPTPSPAPDGPASIFTYDTCSPPCWFGLIPGESTSEDAWRFLQTADSIDLPLSFEQLEGTVDPDTGYVTDGYYGFHLGPYDISPWCCGYSIIVIKDGIVYRISIAIREYITVSEVLNALGPPDQIRLNSILLRAYMIDFIYLEGRLTITFMSPDVEEAECRIDEIETLFLGLAVSYFSPEAALEPKRTPDRTVREYQPALVVYQSNQRFVPPQTWEQWWSGEVDQSCQEAWRELPDEMILPELTPEPSAIPTPRPSP